MIFADNPHDREIEKMMQKTPHFRPRGHGIFVSEKTEYNAERCGCKECADRKKKRRVSGEKTPCVEQRIHEGQIPQPRVLMETFTAVSNPEFIIRINEYIKESEKQPKFNNNMEENNMEKMRTLAFQVPEDLFQKVKDYLQRNNISQKQFVIGLIEREIDRDLTERAELKSTEHPDEELDEEQDEAAYNEEIVDDEDEEITEDDHTEDEDIEETDGELDEADEDEDIDQDEDESEDEELSEDEEETEGMTMSGM